MRSYGLARFIFGVIGFFGGLIVLTGGVIAVVGAYIAMQYWPLEPETIWAGAFLGVVPGIWVSMNGFFLIAAVQNSRADVDVAEYSQQILDVSRKQLEAVRELARAAPRSAVGFERLPQAQSEASAQSGEAWSTLKQESSAESRKPRSNPTSDDDRTSKELDTNRSAPITLPNGDLEYRGKAIRRDQDVYIYAGQTFSDLDAAKTAVDQVVALQRPSLKAER